MSEIQSNTQTMIDFTDNDRSPVLARFSRPLQNGHVVSTPVANSTAWKAFNEVEYAITTGSRHLGKVGTGTAKHWLFRVWIYDYTLSNSSDAKR